MTNYLSNRQEPVPVLQSRLLDSHKQLSTLARGLAASIRDDQRDSMQDDCTLFERELLKHIDWEEMYLLPSFEKVDPETANKLRDDHAVFRRKLGEIGIEIDIHCIRAERFEDFAKELEAHAEREEAMYASAALSTDVHRDSLLRQHTSFFF